MGRKESARRKQCPSKKRKEGQNLPRGCRGRPDLCTKHHKNKPPCKTTCWCSAYRWQLEQPNATMLRIVEDGELGDGQVVEREMAKEVGLPVREINVPGSKEEDTK